MNIAEILDPAGTLWNVPVQSVWAKAVFCRPFGTTWILARFIHVDQKDEDVLLAMQSVLGPIEISVVPFSEEEPG